MHDDVVFFMIRAQSCLSCRCVLDSSVIIDCL